MPDDNQDLDAVTEYSYAVITACAEMGRDVARDMLASVIGYLIAEQAKGDEQRAAEILHREWMPSLFSSIESDCLDLSDPTASLAFH